jgi:hypothetical protein
MQRCAEQAERIVTQGIGMINKRKTEIYEEYACKTTKTGENY